MVQDATPLAGAKRAEECAFVRVEEAAQYLGLSRATVYSLMDRAELKYAKFGRSRRIPRKALLSYAESCVVG